MTESRRDGTEFVGGTCPLRLGNACYCSKRLNSFVGAPANTAALLLAHGSPENPDQIPEFLSYVTGGRPLPQTVVEEIRRRYLLIGFSPLACWTLLQADQLSQSLGMPVFVGMRIGLYRSAVVGDGNLSFKMDFVEQWHDHPLLIKAFAEKLRSGWEEASAENGARLPVIFTAHSVPQRTIAEGDPYERQSKETARLVANEASLAADDWTFAFQSQGASGGPWIGPTVGEAIKSLKAKGHRGVFLHTVGFLCDHVEVLYDIDIAFKQFAEKEGMRLWRAESLNGSKTLTAALANIVRSRV